MKPLNLADLGQQTQDTWTILETNPSGNDGRLTEQKLSGIDNSGPDNHGLIIGHQSDENTSEIAQSSYHQKHYTESQTWETGTNKSSTHHKNTIWDEIKKEEIGQENEDTVESDLAQATDLDQQTQVTWGNINQNQNSYNPWHQETDKVQVDLTNSEQNHPNTFQDMPNPHPWMYNQVHHSSADTNQYFAHSFSSSSSGSHSHSYNSYISNGQTNSTGSTSGSSIMSLWDKLYNIEKQTIPSHQTDDTGKQSVGQDDTANVSNTQAQHNVFDSNIAENERIEGIANAFDSHVHHNVFNSHNSNTQPLRPNTASSASTTSNPTTEAIKEDEQKRPVDLGRGDIGADDSNEQIESQPDSKPHKTPEEIETLSLTRETNKTNKHVVAPENKNEDERDLSVLPIDQQNQSEHQNTEKHSMLQADASVATTTSATQINNYNMQHHENTHHSNEEQESRDMGSQFEDQGQQSLDQQTLIHQIEDSQENQNQNTEQQLVDFGQRENLGAEQFETQNINNNEAEDGQIEQFDQVSLSEWKPVESLNQHEHKHENGGPKNMNSEQQIHSVWTGIIEDQEVQTARQPTEDAQQHSEQTNIYGKPIEDLSQKEQSVWKLTKELQQGKPTEQFDKPREDFDQQVQTDLTEGLQQESQLTDTFSQPMDQNKEHASNYHNQPGKLTEELQQSQLTEQFDRPWEDFGQQVQMDLTEGLQQESQLTATFSQPIDQNKEHASNYHKQPEVVEELIVPKKVAAVDSPPEPEVTEKPGFWKSVGNKFKDAKHTVTSWFSS
ncbi:Uncharacterized protein OBRU01_01222 [Operophtera brumata]|uniref:Uncharacterized protein n=1 Tax=Operophtera brumata TaxID=104452 RepID=A0A0L7LV13_OPEBR|nr:Uncharacterized protein OBRU01_01222 [Operophtera brumata]